MSQNDAFTLIKNLKPGGQKNVYLIQHQNYGTCVLKVGKCSSSSGLQRIKREVEILKDIDSQYFPKNFEFTYCDDGKFQIIEQYIESKNLSECKEYFTDENTIINLFLQLIDGLKLLWDKRIVHRDIKPDNILIKSNLTPAIIDLGIARDLQGESLTQTILQRGPCTPVYASPEQLSNDKDNIDIRTDFFALGIIMAELFLKTHPFSPELVGKGMSIIENISDGNYSLNSYRIMSDEFQEVIRKLLEVKPYNRYRTYQMLQRDLCKIIGKECWM